MSVLTGSTRHAVRRVVGRYPDLYLPVARRRRPHGVIRSDTDIVIDGFTRSAVTFAVIAFQVAQNAHVRVAHHLHAPAQLVQAARQGVPALVPVREPENTILSAMSREPTVSIGQWLRTYADFYRRLVELADRLVLARFEAVTGDLGSLIGRVNERFGTSFLEFKHTDADVAIVFDLIDERSRRPPWQPLLGAFLAGRISFDEYREATAEQREALPLRDVPEDRVQRPSEQRQALQTGLRSRYLSPRLAPLRARAEDAYRAVEALAF